MPDHKRQRPAAARADGDRLKLHLRLVSGHRVITLRPGTRAEFSTNFYHGTWHVLSDPHGARLFSRLLWGLSYQRRPGTVLLLDRRFIGPNPFDAEPGDPVLVVPADLTHLPSRTARALTRLPAVQPTTVRWHTWGLDQAAATWRATRADRARLWRWERPDDVRRAEVDRRGGVLVLRASASLLRSWAVGAAVMGDHPYDGMSYTELVGPRWELCRTDGEVQTFTDYRRQVSVARVSRREVLASQPAPAVLAELRPLVWAHNATVRARREVGRGGRKGNRQTGHDLSPSRLQR